MHALKILIIGCSFLAISACTLNKKNVQKEINQSATKQGFSYNVYESFDTIPNYKAVDPVLFQQIINHPNTILVDIRTPAEISQGKIKNTALEIDFYESDFEEKLKTLDRKKIYALYCRSGNRSKQALKKMEALGFKEVYHLYGGINKWNKFIKK